jgi:hypothetical protein
MIKPGLQQREAQYTLVLLPLPCRIIKNNQQTSESSHISDIKRYKHYLLPVSSPNSPSHLSTIERLPPINLSPINLSPIKPSPPVTPVSYMQSSRSSTPTCPPKPCLKQLGKVCPTTQKHAHFPPPSEEAQRYSGTHLHR